MLDEGSPDEFRAEGILVINVAVWTFNFNLIKNLAAVVSKQFNQCYSMCGL